MSRQLFPDQKNRRWKRVQPYITILMLSVLMLSGPALAESWDNQQTRLRAHLDAEVICRSYPNDPVVEKACKEYREIVSQRYAEGAERKRAADLDRLRRAAELWRAK